MTSIHPIIAFNGRHYSILLQPHRELPETVCILYACLICITHMNAFAGTTKVVPKTCQLLESSRLVNHSFKKYFLNKTFQQVGVMQQAKWWQAQVSHGLPTGMCPGGSREGEIEEIASRVEEMLMRQAKGPENVSDEKLTWGDTSREYGRHYLGH